MNQRNISDLAVAELLRCKDILEVERKALFDALTGLLSHMKPVGQGHGMYQTVLVCGMRFDDRQFEAALRHAQLVLQDESAAATARLGRTTERREPRCNRGDTRPGRSSLDVAQEPPRLNTRRIARNGVM